MITEYVDANADLTEQERSEIEALTQDMHPQTEEEAMSLAPRTIYLSSGKVVTIVPDVVEINPLAILEELLLAALLKRTTSPAN